jgi:hypothetical protein
MAPHLIIAFGHVSTACCCSLRVHVKACPVDPAGSQLLCLANHSSAQAVAASRASPGLSRRGSGFILYPRRFGMLGAPPADSLLMPSATSCRKSALTRPILSTPPSAPEAPRPAPPTLFPAYAEGSMLPVPSPLSTFACCVCHPNSGTLHHSLAFP